MENKFSGLDKKLSFFLTSIESLLKKETIENPQDVLEIHNELCAIGKELFDKLSHMTECFDHPVTRSYPSKPVTLFVEKKGESAKVFMMDINARNQLAIALEVWGSFKYYWINRRAAMEEFGLPRKNSDK